MNLQGGAQNRVLCAA